MASRLEKTSFEVIFTSLRLFFPTLRNYVPLHESQKERDKFLKGMNELMKWADLSAQTLEQLLLWRKSQLVFNKFILLFEHISMDSYDC
jgi:hypothetical protein